MIKMYSIMILPVVSNDCKTLSLILRGEHREMQREFENSVLRQTVGPGREDITGG
jgi:hypothetical protein